MKAVSIAQALETGDLASVRRAPKADCHCHCYFATRIENVERWLGHSLERPATPMRGLRGMLRYSSRALDPYINSLAGFQFTAESAVEDAIEDGVRRLEMSFDVRSAGHFETGFAGFTSFIRQLVESHRGRIDLRPELGIARESIGNGEMESRAREGIDSDLFRSIDIYGDELMIFGQSVSQEYMNLFRAGVFSADELESIRAASLGASS